MNISFISWLSIARKYKLKKYKKYYPTILILPLKHLFGYGILYKEWDLERKLLNFVRNKHLSRLISLKSCWRINSIRCLDRLLRARVIVRVYRTSLMKILWVVFDRLLFLWFRDKFCLNKLNRNWSKSKNTKRRSGTRTACNKLKEEKLYSTSKSYWNNTIKTINPRNGHKGGPVDSHNPKTHQNQPKYNNTFNPLTSISRQSNL